MGEIDKTLSKPLQLQRSQKNMGDPRTVSQAPIIERDNAKIINIRISGFSPYKRVYQAINPKLKGEYLTFMEKGRNDEYKYVIINTTTCREIRSNKPI